MDLSLIAWIQEICESCSKRCIFCINTSCRASFCFHSQPPVMCFNWRIIPMAYLCPCFDFVSTSESLSLVLVCASHLQTTVCCACSPTGETRRHAKSRHFEVLRWHNYQDASCMMFGTGQTGFPLANDTFGWILQEYTNFSSNISWHNRHHNHRDHYII